MPNDTRPMIDMFPLTRQCVDNSYTNSQVHKRFPETRKAKLRNTQPVTDNSVLFARNNLLQRWV